MLLDFASEQFLIESQLKNQLLSVENYTEVNCKNVPADGVVRAQNKCETRKCFTGEVTGKKVTGTVKAFKTDQLL